LRAVFQRAGERQPSVILFDEIDGIAGTRTGDSCQRTFVAQLQTLLDGLEDRGRVFTIATPNRPPDIDPAHLAAATADFSGAQIACLCRRAGVLCIKEAIREKTPNHDMFVTMKHFLRAIQEIQSSIPSSKPSNGRWSHSLFPIEKMTAAW
jgi:SpoVK/Ycf46/Vps4 family AAA+-type ATPase